LQSPHGPHEVGDFDRLGFTYYGEPAHNSHRVLQPRDPAHSVWTSGLAGGRSRHESIGQSGFAVASGGTLTELSTLRFAGKLARGGIDMARRRASVSRALLEDSSKWSDYPLIARLSASSLLIWDMLWFVLLVYLLLGWFKQWSSIDKLPSSIGGVLPLV